MSPVPAATFAEVEEVVADIEGWMTPGQDENAAGTGRAAPGHDDRRNILNSGAKSGAVSRPGAGSR